MVPEKIGRYEIKGELGRGGMATVYKAHDPRSEREVAVKVLPREMLHDPQFRTRFEREAKTIAMLEHPVIVPVYDFGEEDGQPYFVMRYMTGGSLSERIRNGPLTVQEAARIMDRLAPGLDDAHAKGIIHRDLKPGNILFDRLGEPYISDFGIAKLTEAQATVTGSAIVGTPAYMSPEQAQGEAVDGRSDIYGLGIILFEMLTGQQPYKGDTPMSVVIKHITDPVPHILDVNPNLPAAIEGVVEKALAKNRNERFSTARELAIALNEVARSEAPTPKPVTSIPVGPVPTITSTPGKKVSAPATRIAKKPAPATPMETVAAKPGELPQGLTVSARPEAAVAPARKKSKIWIFIPVGAIILIAGVITIITLLNNPAAPLTTPTQTRSPEITVQPSATLEIHLPTQTLENLQATFTTAPEPPTSTPKPAGLPALGGADMIAFVGGGNVWVMNMDGSGLRQLTTDAAAKHDLQWMPDRENIAYISGKCIQIVNINTSVVTTLTCFIVADYLEAFQISPDGTQVAISLNRELYIVPLNLEKLTSVRSRDGLDAMNGCFSYTQAGTTKVRWSKDGLKIALGVLIPVGDRIAETIYVMDIHRCETGSPTLMDAFPEQRFTMTGYGDNRVIPEFDWDGELLFVLNSSVRNEGYGYLYAYNLQNSRADNLDPLGTGCCYRDARWSPDGSHVLFAYQDINKGAEAKTQLYYVPYGTISTGAILTPLPIPADVFPGNREKPQPALRPAQ